MSMALAEACTRTGCGKHIEALVSAQPPSYMWSGTFVMMHGRRELSRDEAIEHLARRLHWKMEHLEPTDDGSSWDLLTDRQQDFYRVCVRAIFDERQLSRAALK
jgi:hypothetical protein